MKEYPKTYEDVFSSDYPGSKAKLKVEKVSARGMDVNEYIDLSKSFLRETYSTLFDISVKFAWLRRRFQYGNEKATPQLSRNSIRFCDAYMKLMRRTVGIDPQLITRSKFFQNLEPWLEVMFPGFDEGNPFENPDYYKWPFKNITHDYLMVVHQIDDCIDLLKIADKRKMSYAQFVDYVVNHVYSINEEIGRNKYQIRHNRMNRFYLFFIKDIDRKFNKRYHDGE